MLSLPTFIIIILFFGSLLFHLVSYKYVTYKQVTFL